MNMKKLTLALVLTLSFPLLAFAENTPCNTCEPLQLSTQMKDSQQQSQTQGQTANSGSEATNQGNAQTINFNQPGNTNSTVEYSGTQTIKNVPSVSGPPLTTSNDTCMGSTSGSLNIAGIGIGGGSTWTDTNCKRLKNSRELWNMGMKGAAMELMCMDKDNATALKATGYECKLSASAQETKQKSPIGVE